MNQMLLGRVVLYTLTDTDAQQINARRTTPAEIQDQVVMGCWSIGAQAHVGARVAEGEVVAAIVVRALPTGDVNLKLMLDGTDVLWCRGKRQATGSKPGHWHWPASCG